MHGENDMIHDQSLRKYSYKKSKIEDWISNKKDDYFIICQHKTEEPRNIKISAPTPLGFVLVSRKHVSKMTVFQTFDKKYGIKNEVI